VDLRTASARVGRVSTNSVAAMRKYKTIVLVLAHLGCPGKGRKIGMFFLYYYDKPKLASR